MWPLHISGPGDPKANQFGKPEPRSWDRMQSILDGLTSTFPLPQIGVAVGTVEEPGPAHENASCSHTWTPPITPVACCNYGWNRSSLKEFIRRVEAAGITELDVWREDLQPPPGQVRRNYTVLHIEERINGLRADRRAQFSVVAQLNTHTRSHLISDSTAACCLLFRRVWHFLNGSSTRSRRF